MARSGRGNGGGQGMGSGRGSGRGGGFGGGGKRSSFGPSTYCICPKCQTKIQHARGVPCTETKCPKCGSNMIGDQAYNASANNISTGKRANEDIIQTPVIDKSICTGCGECVEACPFNAISLKDGKAEIDYPICKHCNVCVKACPVGAIS